jgi:hypothetical protein
MPYAAKEQKMPYAPKKQKKWPKELEQPIFRFPDTVVKIITKMETLEERSAWVDQWIEQQRYEKLRLLLRHYKIEGETPRAWFQLTRALAMESVPGMKLAKVAPKGVGRPGRWNHAEGEVLVREVEILAEHSEESVSEIIGWLCQKNNKYASVGRKSLEKRFYEVRKRLRGS